MQTVLNFITQYPIICLIFAALLFVVVLVKRGAKMTFGVLTMTAFTLFLLAGGFPADDFDAIPLYRQPVFLVTTMLMVFSMIHICWKHTKSWKKIGFHLTHLGVVITLIGAFIGMLLEVNPPSFNMIVGEDFVYHQMFLENKQSPRGMHQAPPSIELPFGIAVKSFKAEMYPSTAFNIFKREDVKGPYGQVSREYKWKDQVKIENSRLNHELIGQISENTLLEHGQGKLPFQYVVNDEVIIEHVPPIEKSYIGEFRIYHDDTREKFTDFDWTVNKPVDWEGWRFYLMSYSEPESPIPSRRNSSRTQVIISARKDPGFPYVRAGIYMTLIGTALLCFIRRKQPSTEEVVNV